MQAPAPPPLPPAPKAPESASSFQMQAQPAPPPTLPPAPAAKPAEPAAAEKPAKKIGPQPVQPVRKEKVGRQPQENCGLSGNCKSRLLDEWQPGVQAKAEEAKPGKRKGPLPAALVQLLLLAAFGGLGYLVFFKEQQVDKAVTGTAKAVISAYRSVSGIFNKQSKKA